MKKDIRQITLGALFCAFICVGAFIKIPIPNLPITMQMFFVLLGAMTLKPKVALFSVGVYIFLGLVGLPVFASGGGAAYVLTPSFGYIIGFLPGVYLGARCCFGKGQSLQLIIKAAAICLLAVYAVGIPYFCMVSRFVLDISISPEYIIKLCLLAMLPGDILSAALAGVVAKRLKRMDIM